MLPLPGKTAYRRPEEVGDKPQCKQRDAPDNAFGNPRSDKKVYRDVDYHQNKRERKDDVHSRSMYLDSHCFRILIQKYIKILKNETHFVICVHF